jgi:hypothetical protein
MTDIEQARECVAKAIWQGWCESNETWEEAGPSTQMQCYFAADAVLALPAIAVAMRQEPRTNDEGDM